MAFLSGFLAKPRKVKAVRKRKSKTSRRRDVFGFK